MFKNLFLYASAPEWTLTASDIEARLQHRAFTPCGPTQQASIGFEPPREANGAMLEVIGGQWLMKVTVERKAVPADVLKRHVEKLADVARQQTGHNVGKKQKKELKEQALLELLPQAFPKRSSSLVWYDPTTSRLAIEASSQSRADDVVSAMVEYAQFGGRLISTTQSPSVAMGAWLLAGHPDAEDFSIDRECELVSADELRSVVKYGRHPLDLDNVREHLQQGKVCTKLALTWRDRVSFVLTDGMQLKKIDFLDVALEAVGPHEKADAFDASVAIATGELQGLITDLIAALGGEFVEGGAA